MKSAADFIAVDLGASAGRVMTGRWNGQVFSLQELHRFPNGGVPVGKNFYWDVLGIWSQIRMGLAKYRSGSGGAPVGIGVDAWGVDFAMLDSAGRLMGNPFHYRDARTDGMLQRVFETIPDREIFAETGNQTMQINTLFQVYSLVLNRDPQLASAATLLSIPDLFLYFLSGAKGYEFTEATTTQMYSAAHAGWAEKMLERLQIPLHVLPEVVQPGTIVAPVRDCCLGQDVSAVAVASHDTASAVAAIPCMDDRSAFISSGTWSLMGVEAAEANTSEEAFRLHFTNEGSASGAFLLLKNITGLWLLQECLQHWKTQGRNYTWSEVVDAAGKAKAFGSVCDPNDQRLQVQSDMPTAIQTYCRNTGQRLPETIGEFARFTFESLSLKYRAVLESLESLTGRTLRVLRVVGGGSQNALLCQMTADACNRPVVSGPAEASALGNVVLQAIATGHLPNLAAGRAAIADSVDCTTFDPHPSDAWEETYARFRRMEVD